MIHLVTGYAGYEHITSADEGAFNAATFSEEQYVATLGNAFAATIIDNNTVRIADGEAMMFGRHFRINPNTYEDVTITTGTAGRNRIDLIVATYQKNEDNGIETVYLEVIKGTEASSAVAPAYTTGNIVNGAIFNQMPLYKVTLSGITISKVEPLFTPIPALDTVIMGLYEEIQKIKNNSSDIKNLGSAAYTDKSAYATAAQGTLATNITTDIKHIKYVTALPSSPNADTLYLVKK